VYFGLAVNQIVPLPVDPTHYSRIMCVAGNDRFVGVFEMSVFRDILSVASSRANQNVAYSRSKQSALPFKMGPLSYRLSLLNGFGVELHIFFIFCGP
jgi:hypothetical protein